MKLAAFVIGVWVACGVAPVRAQSTAELEASLFVQTPPGNGMADGIQVLWLPQPIEQYCMGKTAQQCSDIDYCLRTTNKKPSCQNLGVDVARLPAYPNDIRPRRVLGVIYFREAPIKGMDKLVKYYDSKSKDSLARLSANARIRAKIKLIRTSDDDQFELLEVLGGP